MSALDLYLPLVILGACLGMLWIAPIAEANRLEAVVQSTADEVTRELGAAELGEGGAGRQ
jgi:hypothetical protein